LKKIAIILLYCIAVLLFGCSQQDDGFAVTEKGYIQLRLSADNGALTRAMQDVDDISTWYAVVSNDAGILYDQQIGSELGTRSFDPGTYAISVRSHDNADEANTSDNGWGEAYHTGEANNIEVSAGGTAYVHIACGRALNAKFRLDYSEFSGIINAFTISSPKNLTFAYADGTLAREAYFAPNSTITYTINYTLGDDTKTTEAQTLTLGGAATVSILKIKSDIHGTVSLSLTCDDEFEGDANAEIDIDGTTGQ
jgi:hypothetical protein